MKPPDPHYVAQWRAYRRYCWLTYLVTPLLGLTLIASTQLPDSLGWFRPVIIITVAVLFIGIGAYGYAGTQLLRCPRCGERFFPVHYEERPPNGWPPHNQCLRCGLPQGAERGD